MAEIAQVVEVLNKKYAAISRVENIEREIAELKAGPAFVSKEPRERGNRKTDLSLGGMFFAQAHVTKHGTYPTEKSVQKEVDYVKRAMSAGSTGNGGFLIGEEWNSQIIAELGPVAVMLAAGPNIIPISTKKGHLTGFGTDATCQWLTEATSSTESSPGTVEATLQLQSARLFTKVSYEWLRYATPETDAALAANLTRVLARFVDGAYFFGSGSGRPTGLGSLSGITAVGAANNAANGGSVTTDDILGLDGALNSANVSQAKRAFFMHPRSWDRVRGLKDTTNRPLIYMDLQNPLERRLLGYPVYLTTQIPVNQTKGTGTALSSIFLLAMDDIFVGVGAGENGIDFAVSEHAAFQTAEVAYRLIFQTDIVPGHVVSVGVMNGVQ